MKMRNNMEDMGRIGRTGLIAAALSRSPTLPLSHAHSILASLLLALCSWLFALTANSAPINDVPETWDVAGDLAGWARSETTITLLNPGGMLDISFRNQSGPASPQSAITLAGLGASGGRFVGNYSGLVKGISFRVQAVNMKPSAMWLIFRSGVSSNEWHINLKRPDEGVWTTYAVPLDYGAGWTIGPSKTEAKFLNDLQDVVWVGLYLRRNASPSTQHYYFDDFQLLSVAPVYTKPRMRISRKSLSDADIELEWESVAGQQYGLWRSTNLVKGTFIKVKDRIDGMPPWNAFDDTNAVGAGPYFYRVNVETN